MDRDEPAIVSARRYRSRVRQPRGCTDHCGAHANIWGQRARHRNGRERPDCLLLRPQRNADHPQQRQARVLWQHPARAPCHVPGLRAPAPGRHEPVLRRGPLEGRVQEQRRERRGPDRVQRAGHRGNLGATRPLDGVAPADQDRADLRARSQDGRDRQRDAPRRDARGPGAEPAPLAAVHGERQASPPGDRARRRGSGDPRGSVPPPRPAASLDPTQARPSGPRGAVPGAVGRPRQRRELAVEDQRLEGRGGAPARARRAADPAHRGRVALDEEGRARGAGACPRGPGSTPVPRERQAALDVRVDDLRPLPEHGRAHPLGVRRRRGSDPPDLVDPQDHGSVGVLLARRVERPQGQVAARARCACGAHVATGRGGQVDRRGRARGALAEGRQGPHDATDPPQPARPDRRAAGPRVRRVRLLSRQGDADRHPVGAPPDRGSTPGRPRVQLRPDHAPAARAQDRRTGVNRLP